MSESSVHAIVLKRRDQGESDRRLTLLTRERGLLEVVAKGARKPGSRLAGCSEPLSASTLHLAKGRQTAYITQVQPATSFPGLRTDYDRLSMALALAEMVAATLPYDQPCPEAFSMVLQCMHHLESHQVPSVAFVWAQLKVLEAAGETPQFNRCVVEDEPVAEAMAALSPRAGGYVRERHAEGYGDVFRVRAEVLFGLAKTSELDAPPPRLKFVEESAFALARFWRHSASCKLPAMDAAIQVLQAGLPKTASAASTT